ncbi:MAG: hypothetical protein OHK0046_30870 [Anaerolineae bacterium]
MPFRKVLSLFVLLVLLATATFAQENLLIFTDPAVDAPALAYRGEYGVGVQTLEVVNEGVVDVLGAVSDPSATTDRALSLEIFYPGIIPDGTEQLTQYTDSNVVEGFQFWARALREADPDLSGGPYPLLVVSHGLGGNSLQLSYLGDHLASKGYVVVMIDHADGAVGLASVQTATTYRPMDILFVMDQIDAMNSEADSFLSGMVDVNNTGLIGYSYGGYGTLIVSGAGISEAFATNPLLSPGGAALPYQEGSIEADPRVKALFMFAPFGNDLRALGFAGASYWTPEALASVTVPTFIMVGSDDDVAQYATGVLPTYEALTGADRHLLTLLNARHNVAPNPSPPTDDMDTYLRYGEPVWRSERMNNIAQHFVTAFMGIHLKAQEDYTQYLDLIEVASEGSTDAGTHWAGFPNRSAIGMTYRFTPAGS